MTTSDFLSREQILAAVDTVYEEVAVPEWGGAVLVKSLSGAERDRVEATIVQSNGKKGAMNLQNLRAKFVAWSAVDPTSHQRLFTDADIVALGEKSAAALQRVFNVVQRLSGLNDEDLEGMIKNSGIAPNGSSGSA
jgi:hypothetical protein